MISMETRTYITIYSRTPLRLPMRLKFSFVLETQRADPKQIPVAVQAYSASSLTIHRCSSLGLLTQEQVPVRGFKSYRQTTDIGDDVPVGTDQVGRPSKEALAPRVWDVLLSVGIFTSSHWADFSLSGAGLLIPTNCSPFKPFPTSTFCSVAQMKINKLTHSIHSQRTYLNWLC